MFVLMWGPNKLSAHISNLFRNHALIEALPFLRVSGRTRPYPFIGLFVFIRSVPCNGRFGFVRWLQSARVLPVLCVCQSDYWRCLHVQGQARMPRVQRGMPVHGSEVEPGRKDRGTYG